MVILKMLWRHCLSRTLWQCRLWGQAQNIWPGSKNQNSPENYTPYSGHSSRSHKLTQIPNPKCLMYSKNQNSLKNNPPYPGPILNPKYLTRIQKWTMNPKQPLGWNATTKHLTLESSLHWGGNVVGSISIFGIPIQGISAFDRQPE